jgi:dolichol-phosphate mannosyltransferase
MHRTAARDRGAVSHGQPHRPDHRQPSSPSVWVLIPTYDEIDNLAAIVAAVEREIPHAHILILDDNSPDGTGRLADELAETRPHLLVLHRPAKEGLGPAYEEGMRFATEMGASVIVQMDADLSHDPAAISDLIAPIVEGADLVLGSRYMPGGRVVDWGKTRLAISRCGNLVARSMLGLGLSDLTGGFKAWRAGLLEEIDLEAIEATGYGFQIEMTWRAHGC